MTEGDWRRLIDGISLLASDLDGTLLRRDGYPCIFYADYYGAHYKDDQGNPAIPDALAALAYDATNMLLQAIKERASDIHIESFERLGDAAVAARRRRHQLGHDRQT